ncbi:MAG TPA: DNA-processing protein DprA [Candidatus Cybelea sp.]|jgi:DNA processing protein
MDKPEFVQPESIEAVRQGRGFDASVGGVWCVGTIESLRRPCVAVVGTRAATPLGKRLARDFGRDLGSAGCTVISGLALGIDAAAHEGALEAGAPTIGILGGGHRHFFPRRNLDLAKRMIAGGGAVLSPFPPDEIPRPYQFLSRNVFVAGLADALVVVEAPARSGAIHTSGLASGRIPTFAVPGDVDRRHVAGCHALIRDGSILARSAADVLEGLRLPLSLPGVFAPPEPDNPVERDVLAAVGDGARSLDELAAATGFPASALLAAMTALELRGHVEPRGSGDYARKRVSA